MRNLLVIVILIFFVNCDNQKEEILSLKNQVQETYHSGYIEGYRDGYQDAIDETKLEKIKMYNKGFSQGLMTLKDQDNNFENLILNTIENFDTIKSAYLEKSKKSRNGWSTSWVDFGIQLKYKMLKNRLGIKVLENVTGEKVFLSGPHLNGELNLKSHYDFGHYNPEFLKIVSETIDSLKDNSELMNYKELVYNKSFKKLLRTYYAAYKYLYVDSSKTNFRYEVMKKNYSLKVENKRYYGGGNSNFDNLKNILMDYGFDHVIVTVACKFWIRRDIDGTKDLFCEILEKTIGIFDNDFIINYYRILKDMKEAGLFSETVISDNKEYKVTIKGKYYEGYRGDQKIYLIDSTNDTLWEKKASANNLIAPAISNNGDVTITNNKINLYNKNGDLLGDYLFKKNENHFHLDWNDYAVQRFSNYNNDFFIFLTTKIPTETRRFKYDTFLVCFSDSLDVKWRVNLKKFYPNKILFYNSFIFVHDFGVAMSGYENGWHILDINGNKLDSCQFEIKNPQSIDTKLDSDEGEFIINYNEKQHVIDLDSLLQKNNK